MVVWTYGDVTTPHALGLRNCCGYAPITQCKHLKTQQQNSHSVLCTGRVLFIEASWDIPRGLKESLPITTTRVPWPRAPTYVCVASPTPYLKKGRQAQDTTGIYAYWNAVNRALWLPKLARDSSANFMLPSITKTFLYTPMASLTWRKLKDQASPERHRCVECALEVNKGWPTNLW